MGQVSHPIYLNSKSKLNVFPFKIMTLESNLLSHFYLSHFCTLLDGLFLDAPHHCCYILLEGFHVFKTGHLMIPLSLGKEILNMEQGQVNREVFLVRQCSSCPENAGCSELCEEVLCRDEAATICPATKAHEKIQCLQKAKIMVI